MALPAKDPVHRFTVTTAAAGARLDKWLADSMTPVSRARIQALIAAGDVVRDGRAVRDGAHKVRAGESFTVRLPPPVAAAPVAQPMALDVVYEDEALIVVNKPAGLVVHPAAGNPDRTLVNALLAHCGDSLAGIGGVARPGIVHRLDKDTSGLLVVAKTDGAHTQLAAQFAAHSIERRYDALVWGVPHPRKDVITGNIGRSPHNRKKMALLKCGGRSAETHYSVVTAFGTLAAHVQCVLKTGRTHQIRVHMSARGHPLIGDPVYGSGRKAPRGTAPDLAVALAQFGRQALHAAVLGFTHPTTGKTMRFERPPPADFSALARALAHTA
jgi:23S rRNA pseudouridine1911/1915/1917 synthase